MTEAMRDAIEKNLARLGKMLMDATEVIVRLSGARKNGWSQKVRIEAHFKGAVVAVDEFLSRVSPVADFYGTIQEAFRKVALQISNKKLVLTGASGTAKKRNVAKIFAMKRSYVFE